MNKKKKLNGIINGDIYINEVPFIIDENNPDKVFDISSGKIIQFTDMAMNPNKPIRRLINSSEYMKLRGKVVIHSNGTIQIGSVSFDVSNDGLYLLYYERYGNTAETLYKFIFLMDPGKTENIPCDIPIDSFDHFIDHDSYTEYENIITYVKLPIYPARLSQSKIKNDNRYQVYTVGELFNLNKSEYEVGATVLVKDINRRFTLINTPDGKKWHTRKDHSQSHDTGNHICINTIFSNFIKSSVPVTEYDFGDKLENRLIYRYEKENKAFSYIYKKDKLGSRWIPYATLNLLKNTNLYEIKEGGKTAICIRRNNGTFVDIIEGIPIKKVDRAVKLIDESFYKIYVKDSIDTEFCFSTKYDYAVINILHEDFSQNTVSVKLNNKIKILYMDNSEPAIHLVDAPCITDNRFSSLTSNYSILAIYVHI